MDSSLVDALLHPWSGRLERLSHFPPLEPLNIKLKPLYHESHGDDTPRLYPVLKQSPDPHFQNAFLRIAPSRIAGWGAFAVRDLSLGDDILKERPLLVADHLTLERQFDGLDEGAKSVALSLHASGGKLETSRIRKIWDTNCFTLGYDDALAGLFPIAARFNHACHPANKVGFAFDRRRGHLTMTVRVDGVVAGDELTISYGNGRSPIQLYAWYGFRCRCGACEGLDEDEVKQYNEAQW